MQHCSAPVCAWGDGETEERMCCCASREFGLGRWTQALFKALPSSSSSTTGSSQTLNLESSKYDSSSSWSLFCFLLKKEQRLKKDNRGRQWLIFMCELSFHGSTFRLMSSGRNLMSICWIWCFLLHNKPPGAKLIPKLVKTLKKNTPKPLLSLLKLFCCLISFHPSELFFFLKPHKCTVHSSFFSCNVINPISTHHVPLPEKPQKESFLYLSFMPAQPLELWSFLNFGNKATLLHHATTPLLHHFVNKVFPQTQRCLTSFCNELC